MKTTQKSSSNIKKKYFKYTSSSLDDKDKETQVLNRNIIVLGPRKSGKTKFLNLILEHKVDLFKYFPTIGIDYRISLFNYIVSNENDNNERFYLIRFFIYEISNSYIENIFNKLNTNMTNSLCHINGLTKTNPSIYIIFLDVNEVKTFDLLNLSKKYKNIYNSDKKNTLYVFIDVNNKFQNKINEEENLFILNFNNFNLIQRFLYKVFDLCI